jgi:hypothetical protein
LPAICREPAARPVHAECQAQLSRRFCPQGVGARLPAICREPAAKPVHAEYQAQLSRLVLPAARRSPLARALPGTGSKTYACGVPGTTEWPGSARRA